MYFDIYVWDWQVFWNTEVRFFFIDDEVWLEGFDFFFFFGGGGRIALKCICHPRESFKYLSF